MNRPPPHVHGKEGVDGSSPSEGYDEGPANPHFIVVCLQNADTFPTRALQREPTRAPAEAFVARFKDELDDVEGRGWKIAYRELQHWAARAWGARLAI
jgi:hypothetical protein